jgi:hypothetical protein
VGDNISYTRFVGRISTDEFLSSEPLARQLVEDMRHDPKQFEEAYQAPDPEPEPAAA